MEDEFLVTETSRYKLLAVFDGHGGKYVSEYLKANFNRAFENSLQDNEADSGAALVSGGTEGAASLALKSALAAVDEEILSGPLSRKMRSQGSTSCMLYLERVPSNSAGAVSMSSVLSANVGDSRAVLARGTTAIDLTVDHKPNDPVERNRVEALGGAVTWHGRLDEASKPIEGTGVYRVNRTLALSRAMGDRDLRPYVTSEPDFQHVPFTPEDEFVIVATDGVWDVISSQECVTLIHQIMKEYSIVPPEVRNFSAAERKEFDTLHRAKIRNIKDQMSSIITAIALRRGSTDNITVLIQWLKDD